MLNMKFLLVFLIPQKYFSDYLINFLSYFRMKHKWKQNIVFILYLLIISKEKIDACKDVDKGTTRQRDRERERKRNNSYKDDWLKRIRFKEICFSAETKYNIFLEIFA